jgi:hypothetical protein
LIVQRLLVERDDKEVPAVAGAEQKES